MYFDWIYFYFIDIKDEVKRILSYIINFLLLRPLSFGNPAEEGNSDGSMSLTVSIACGFATILIMIVYSLVAVENSTVSSLRETLAPAVVAGTVALALVLILFVVCRSNNALRRRQQLKNKCVELEIKFLWFVGLGVLLFSGKNLAIKFECVKKSSVLNEIASIMSSLLKIVFMLIQLSLITYLRNSQLLGGLLVNYLTGGLLLANTSVWIFFIAREISYIYTFRNDTSPESNSSTWEDCFWHSETQKTFQKFNSCFLSVSMLFFLLSSMFLVRLWPSIQTTSQIRNRYTVNEEDELSTASIPQQENTSCRGNQIRRIVRIVSFSVGLLMGCPFFTMALLMRYVPDDVGIVKVYWNMLSIFCLIVMILIILAGIQNLNLGCIERIPFATWDVVFMFGMAGYVVIFIIGGASFFVCQVEGSSTIFTKNALGLIVTYYHSVYIIVARRTAQSEFRESTTNLFIHIILFCLFLGRWTLQTFLLSFNGIYILKEGEDCLFRSQEYWRMTQYFLIPLNAFYDFQSFVFYYGKIW